jgi:DNA-binding NarL/FixJ family response regulator
VPPDELVAAIRTVASGDAVVAPRITRRLLEEFAGRLPVSGAPQQRLDDRIGLLTERECDVLGAMAVGQSNLEIAASLHLSEATVKTHVSRILAKLEVRDRVQAVIFAYEARLVHPS